MKRRDIRDGFYLLNYFGEEMELLEAEFLDQISSLYVEIFNESWGESWTKECAYKEVLNSFKVSDKRAPVGSFMFNPADELIGFSWGCLTGVDFLDENTDMPFGLPQKEKRTD